MTERVNLIVGFDQREDRGAVAEPGAVITGKGMRVVARRQQICYLLTIPDIDGKCHIIKFNFHVHINPVMPFESKRQPCAPAEWPAVVAAWTS